MVKPHIITGLDIGTGSVKILAASKKPAEESFEVIAQAEIPSFGLRKGVVVDPSKVSEIISSLLEKIREESDSKMDAVYSSIGGGHISCISSKGLVSVSRADQKISEEDVDRVIQAAKTFSLPTNKEIIDFFPTEFIVDGQGGIKEVVGMEGVRLEAEVLLLCCFSPYLRNTTQAILSTGLQINDIVPTSLASSRAILTPKEKELGVVSIDIGAGTTGMAVFEEGSLVSTAVFPVGSAHITNDIAVCLKTDIDTAEKIKLDFGTCSSSKKASSKKGEKKIKIDGEEPLVFSKKQLSDIIEARVSEIFNLVNKELKKIGRQGTLPAGVVLTGGGAKLPALKDLAKKELKLTCRIGIPDQFASLPEDPRFSTVCGLVMHGFDIETEEAHNKGLGRGLGSRIKNIFKIFIP